MKYSIIQRTTDVDNLTIGLNATGKIAQIPKLECQNAYIQLKDGGAFSNSFDIVTDVFTSNTGAKNTVNTGTSTALYNATNDYYTGGYQYDSSITGETTLDPDGFTNPTNAFDNDTGTSASKSLTTTAALDWELGKTFAAKLIKVAYIKFVGTNLHYNVDLEVYDGSTWTSVKNWYNAGGSHNVDEYVIINQTIQGIRLRTTTITTSSMTKTFTIYELNYGEYVAKKVICDQNQLSTDGSEEGIVVWADKDITNNTNVTCDISDGTTTLTNQNLNSFIDISSFVSGTLSITLNVNPDSLGVYSAKVYGYAAALIR